MRAPRLLITTAVLALIACGGGTEPHPLTLDDLAGSYQLVRTGSAGPLPAYLHESVIDPNVGVQHIVGGSFTIAATGGVTREAVRVEIIENDNNFGTWRDTVTTSGAVTLDVSHADEFTFTFGPSALRGAISPHQLTLFTTGEAGSRIYTR